MNSMASHSFDDFIDDCFVEKDPICDLKIEDSIWLDNYASQLIAEMGATPSDEGGMGPLHNL